MAPLPPSSSVSPQPKSLRRPQDHGQGGKRGGVPQPPERSSSFPAKTVTAEQRQMRRPKTLPDLLAGRRNGWMSPEMVKNTGGGGSGEGAVRVPAKVLVNVTVQRSLGALQVMASTEWTVEDLVAAAVRMYVKEGRRPQLPTTEPAAYGLHYSQFSLECLDPKEKLIGLGSRNFFLCPKNNATMVVSAPVSGAETAAASSAHPTSSCSKEVEKASRLGIPWLRFIGFLP